MINRKIVWLTIPIFTLILTGCNAAEGDIKVTENKTHQIYNHDVKKISGIALEGDMDALKIDDDSAAPATLEFNPVTIVNGEPVNSSHKVASFVEELISAKSAVGEIWEEDFPSLYTNYLNHAYIIQNENMTLTEAQTEDIAGRIENLHNEYAELEKNLKDLEVPKSMAENNMGAVETVIDEISRAVENRTLALIEFKSIYEKDDFGKHEELLSIHIGNSEKYINKADESIDDLITAVYEK